MYGWCVCVQMTCRLKISSVAHASLPQEKETVGLGIKGYERLGFYPNQRQDLSLEFFCFHAGRTKMIILAFLYSLWKTRVIHLHLCQHCQYIQLNYNVYSNTKSLNYIKIRLKALIYFELEQTSNWNFKLKPLQIRPQLNYLRISGTSN